MSKQGRQYSVRPFSFLEFRASSLDSQRQRAGQLCTHTNLLPVIQNSASRLFPIDKHEPKSSSSVAENWMFDCIQSSTGGAFIYAALMSSSLATGADGGAYKLDAVQEVNKSLQYPGTLVSDATISAVLMLLCLEEARLADPRLQGPDREQSMLANEAHTNGLKAMIDQRGGLSALYPNRCLQICILL